MKFGVIVCPRCRMVKGVDLSKRTTRCLRCGKILTIQTLKIFYQTDSQERLGSAIGLINAELEGKQQDFQKRLRGRPDEC